VNGSLFFADYEIEPCDDTANAWSMTQHYVVYEQAYQGPQGNTRYRVVRNADQVAVRPEGYNVYDLAFSDAIKGVPLVAVQSVSETERIVVSGKAYSRTALTLNTACQILRDDDPAACLSAWADRVYDFDIMFQDCVASADSAFAQCLPAELRRAYTMFLSVVRCPLLPLRAEISPVASLRLELVGSPGVVLDAVQPGHRVRAVVDTDIGEWLDPFMTDVTVCAIDPDHRLAPCALNQQTQHCPFRGCRGWSASDSPVLFTRDYLTKSEWTASSVLDSVAFCKDKALYDEGGCAAGGCAWSLLPNRTAFGGADGFEFVVFDPPGTILIVDVLVRLEWCAQHARRRTTARSSENVKVRRVQVLRVH
jgi:hypothetical protein